MGIISIEQQDRLYWLGRYVERVYTSIKLYEKHYDIMIDMDKNSYDDFCRRLDIPNIYTSSEDFVTSYAFNLENENSIFSNLMRAYDNAIELREMIHSDSLSYIQLAIYAMNRAKTSVSPLIDLQKAMDDIFAFWGVIDDSVEDELCRNTIMMGKRVERIDLYGRLHAHKNEMTREIQRLSGRIDRSLLTYNKKKLDTLLALVENDVLDYFQIVQNVENLLEITS